MRTGVTLSISSADLDRLRALIGDRNALQKHAWRARIVLLSAEGLGTNAITRETGKSKTCVWRWQERFAAEGFEGLLRDKTRPSRIPKLDAAVAERVVALTMEPPLAEATHWTGAAMAQAAGVSVSSVQRIWRAHGLLPLHPNVGFAAQCRRRVLRDFEQASAETQRFPGHCRSCCVCSQLARQELADESRIDGPDLLLT